MVWRQREARLKWFGHVKRRDGAENSCQAGGKRPWRRFMDIPKEDMERIGVKWK